ncbi:MAG: hypothetical protein ACLQVD_03225, partial [Capsulimonadaceae bacterium]
MAQPSVGVRLRRRRCPTLAYVIRDQQETCGDRIEADFQRARDWASVDQDREARLRLSHKPDANDGSA